MRWEEVGPSPRGWGNLSAMAVQNTITRAIPTRVGKSPQTLPLDRELPGHPHAGGEISGLANELHSQNYLNQGLTCMCQIGAVTQSPYPLA